MYNMPKGHEAFEKKVMEMLLAGDDPFLEGLRYQYKNSSIKGREFTGVGFYTGFKVNKDIPPVKNTKRVIFGDIYADYQNRKDQIGFLLYVENGYLNTLEGYTTLDEWPDDFISIIPHYMKPEGQYGLKRSESRHLEDVRKKWY